MINSHAKPQRSLRKHKKKLINKSLFALSAALREDSFLLYVKISE